MQNNTNLIDAKSSFWSKTDGIRYLTELGLSRIQANLYFNLIVNGRTDARILASLTNTPRTEVYRALNERSCRFIEIKIKNMLEKSPGRR